jgi:hypothetical protein
LDELLGLLFLGVYIVAIVGLAAGITYAVIKIFPTERNPSKPEKPEKQETSSNGDAAPTAGSLFRRSKKQS